jgi:hypothetical protein
VLPGRRRKAADEAAPKAGKGKAAEVAPEEEQLPEEAPVSDAVEETAPAAVEASIEEEAAIEEESEEEKAARYASLGREETPAPASTATPDDGEEE